MTSRSDRLRRTGRSQLSDIRVASRGADLSSLENAHPDRVKEHYHPVPDTTADTVGLALKALGVVGTFAGGTLKGFKQIQSALGEGSRDVGFESGQFVLATVTRDDGSISSAALEGAKDAAMNEPRTNKAPEYRRAYGRVWHALSDVPAEHDVYPRTRNAYRGGIIAALAVVYAAAVGRPMLTRTTIALARARLPRWSPANLVYGQREGPAHSVLEAVKEITERTLAGTGQSVETLEAAQGTLATWTADLERACEAAPYDGPEEAVGAAAAATQHLDTASRLIASAIDELSAWEKEL